MADLLAPALDTVLGRRSGPPTNRVQGTITATSTHTVTVQFASGVTVAGLRFMEPYSPATSDVCWMLEQGGTYLVIGCSSV